MEISLFGCIILLGKYGLEIWTGNKDGKESAIKMKLQQQDLFKNHKPSQQSRNANDIKKSMLNETVN